MIKIKCKFFTHYLCNKKSFKKNYLYSKRVMKFSTVFKKFLWFLPIFAPVYEMACGNPSSILYYDTPYGH